MKEQIATIDRALDHLYPLWHSLRSEGKEQQMLLVRRVIDALEHETLKLMCKHTSLQECSPGTGEAMVSRLRLLLKS